MSLLDATLKVSSSRPAPVDPNTSYLARGPKKRDVRSINVVDVGGGGHVPVSPRNICHYKTHQNPSHYSLRMPDLPSSFRGAELVTEVE